MVMSAAPALRGQSLTPRSFRACEAGGVESDGRQGASHAQPGASGALTYPMKARIFLWSLASALAGFLFGFDTVVISGAEQTIQALWKLSAGVHGLAMA